jgi:cytochrome c-type biogenesis protein CcmH
MNVPAASARAFLALIAALVFFALSPPALALRPPEVLANPQQEARARALQRELRCVVCQGQSLDESNAPLAADLRRLIRERIVAGDSDTAIKDYLVARYGDFILMKPPFDPATYALWLVPPAVLILALAVAMSVVIGARRRAGQT